MKYLASLSAYPLSTSACRVLVGHHPTVCYNLPRPFARLIRAQAFV